MLNIRRSLFTILIIIFLSGIQSNADTYVVTNLNDPGAGSLRKAIDDSNSNSGPDTIVFEEGLEGTIVLNAGTMFINDDLTITGPGADKVAIDADEKSQIFVVNDFDDERNIVVEISGLTLTNGNGAIGNWENLTIQSCIFVNCNAVKVGEVAGTGGAVENSMLMTIDSCLFENNSANFGGAISNEGPALNLVIRNSRFENNQADFGGAIRNDGTIGLITNSTFTENKADLSEFSASGAIQNTGTISEISHCTFNNNTTINIGGGIANFGGLIENIVNSTFTENTAKSGSVIWNDGVINISFATMAKNKPLPVPTPPPPAMGMEPQGVIVTAGDGVTRIRNSILGLNNISSCAGPVINLLGNWSSDTSCGFLGDNVQILLGPLADNGGPTETMALLGGEPVDGATVNCDALNDMGNPTGIPIGIDQRHFPRPFGARCDSGAFETQPTASVTITKVTDPNGGTGFDFDSNGFGSLQGCGLRGDGGNFSLNDGDSINCIVPEGDYSITEDMPPGYNLTIFCLEAPDNLTINNETGEIEFTIEDPGADVDCVYTNIKTGGGGNGGCSLTTNPASSSLAVIPALPLLIFIRRIAKKHNNRREKEVSI